MSVTIGRTADTDDDGSGTTGTVYNNAHKTALYDEIDTALALLLPLAGGAMTGTISGSVVWNAGAVTSSGPLKVNSSGTGTIWIGQTSGSSAYNAIGLAGSLVDGLWNISSSPGDTNLYLNVPSAKLFEFRVNNVAMMQLSSAGVLTLANLASGSLTSASGVITSSSDERLKDIIGPLTYGLAEVLRLKPIRFHWNKRSRIPTKPEYGGFGARQVERVMPLAISRGQDGMRGLSDRVILGATVNAVKVLHKRLLSLERRA